MHCRDSLGLLITNSTIKGNLLSAHSGFAAWGQGGGVWVGNTPLTLILSVVESNVIDSWCDGGYCDAVGLGGGVFAKDSRTSMSLSIIRENNVHGWVLPFSGFNKESCSAWGAGVYVQSDSQSFTATNCLISGNEAKSTGKATFESLEDGSYLATGANPANPTYTVTINPGERSVTAVRLETLTHPNMTKKGLSRSVNGNFVLSEIEILEQ